MRGKVLYSNWTAEGYGITPAYAGKSISTYGDATAVRDHPRLCGEKILCLSAPHLCMGSPPPMRGKVLVGCLAVANCGITPAYAGKSNFYC